MNKVTVELTETQLQMIMNLVSHHMGDLSDDDGNLIRNTERGAQYYDFVRDTYFNTLNPLQSEFA
jgi:hypothetical protein